MNILKINKEKTSIKSYEYFRGNYDEVILHNYITNINESAFALNNIKEIEIPIRLSEIEDAVFYKNNIESLFVPNNIVKIGYESFKGNIINSLTLSEGLKLIGTFAFENNNIEKLIIPNTLNTIQTGAFKNNNLKEIIINTENVNISNNAFENNENLQIIKVLINGEYIDIYKDELEEINHSSIINYAKYKHYFKNANHEFNKLPKEATLLLPANRVNANILRLKTKDYNALLNKLQNYYNQDFNLHDKRSIFKLSYMLNFFKSGNFNDVYGIISNYSLKELNKTFSNIKLNNTKRYKRDNLIKEIVSNDKYKLNKKLIEESYTNYDKVQHYIKLHYNQEINTKLKKKFNKLSNINKEESINELNKIKNEIKSKKESMKTMNVSDVIFFINNQDFYVKPENIELKEIIPYVVGYDQYDFSKIEELYEKSKGLTKNFEITIDNSDNDYTYKWLEADDPYNYVLGFITKTCANMYDEGEEILLESIFNPNIKSLAIYNKDNDIVGKATAYLNDDYILFNSLESDSLIDRDQIKDALIRGTFDQIDALEHKGIIINHVRVGLDNSNFIFNKGNIEIIKENLLDNYQYGKDYKGDGVDVQGIIYKRKESFSLELENK